MGGAWAELCCKLAGMAQSASEGTLFARLFIIVIALGIIVLGIYPIRSDIREVAAKTKIFLRKNLPILTGERRENTDKRQPARVVASSEEPPQPRKPEGVILEEGARSRQKLDRLTTDDRKELSELVNGF